LSKFTEPPAQVSVQFTIKSIHLFILQTKLKNDTYSVVVKLCGLQRSKGVDIQKPGNCRFQKVSEVHVRILGSKNINIQEQQSGGEGG